MSTMYVSNESFASAESVVKCSSADDASHCSSCAAAAYAARQSAGAPSPSSARGAESRRAPERQSSWRTWRSTAAPMSTGHDKRVTWLESGRTGLRSSPRWEGCSR